MADAHARYVYVAVVDFFDKTRAAAYRLDPSDSRVDVILQAAKDGATETLALRDAVQAYNQTGNEVPVVNSMKRINASTHKSCSLLQGTALSKEVESKRIEVIQTLTQMGRFLKENVSQKGKPQENVVDDRDMQRLEKDLLDGLASNVKREELLQKQQALMNNTTENGGGHYGRLPEPYSKTQVVEVPPEVEKSNYTYMPALPNNGARQPVPQDPMDGDELEMLELLQSLQTEIQTSQSNIKRLQERPMSPNQQNRLTMIRPTSPASNRPVAPPTNRSIVPAPGGKSSPGSTRPPNTPDTIEGVESKIQELKIAKEAAIESEKYGEARQLKGQIDKLEKELTRMKDERSRNPNGSYRGLSHTNSGPGTPVSPQSPKSGELGYGILPPLDPNSLEFSLRTAQSNSSFKTNSSSTVGRQQIHRDNSFNSQSSLSPPGSGGSLPGTIGQADFSGLPGSSGDSFDANICIKELSSIHTKSIEERMFEYYMGDTLWKYASKKEEKRKKNLSNAFIPMYMGYAMKQAHVWGVVNDTKLEAITVLFGPDDRLDISFRSFLKNAVEMPIKLGLKTFNKYYNGLKAVDKIHKSIMRGVPHWRILRPTPAAYRPEIRDAMVQQVVQWSMADQVPIYHEVFSIEHRDYFLQWGFLVDKEVKLSEEHGVIIYPLVRPPMKPPSRSASGSTTPKTNSGGSLPGHFSKQPSFTNWQGTH